MTGLEPAASGVTGRRSNQLSYTRMVRGAVYIKTAPWWQVFFDRFLKEKYVRAICRFDRAKWGQNTKKRQRMIAALFLSSFPSGREWRE